MRFRDQVGPQGPSCGRYQTIHVAVYPGTVDLKGSTGDKWTVPVVHPKIEVLAFGWNVATALGAATTIDAVVNLDKQIKNAGARAILSAAAALTFDGDNNVLASDQTCELNTGINGTPIDGPPVRPTAIFGDQLILELITAGTGSGVQTVIPWIAFRERLADQ